MPELKRCYSCKIYKPLSAFNKKAANPDGLQRLCKECARIERKAYYEANKQKEFDNHRKYEETHKEAINLGRKKRRLADDAYYIKHREYINNRKNADLEFLVIYRSRHRISRALRLQGVKACCNILKLLECTPAEYIKHLERSMPEGFDWESYRRCEIHIDHIIPCSLFDLSKPDHQRTCFHFTNTRLLEKRKNVSKQYNIYPSSEELDAIVKTRAL